MSDEEPFEFSAEEVEDTTARDRLREGYEQNRVVVCTACDTHVDLTGATDLNDAAARWNEHVRTEHPSESTDQH